MLKTLRAMCEAVFSTHNGPPPANLLDYVVTTFDSSISHSGFRSRIVFGFALMAISLIAPVLIWRFPGLRRLSLADRVRAISRMEDSPLLAAPVLAVKAIICIAYYEHPEAQQVVGFQGVGFFSPTPNPSVPPAEPRKLAS